jgi:hypothetical protein|tara:strand:+ start:3206 stop:3508 length:303 start_codon:yes stop_codon:yes gene_type:complete
MPFYVFEDTKTKEQQDFFYRSQDVPKIGDVIDVDGKELKRVASFVLDTAGIARKTHKYPYVSRSLPRNIGGCDCNSDGQPIIKSQAHERNVASEYDLAKE